MDCERCAESLTAYIDGELPDVTTHDVKAHLDKCGSCREEYQSLEMSADFVAANVRELQVRPEIWNGVGARVTVLGAPAPGLVHWLTSNPWWTAAATAVTTVALVFGFWGYIRHQQDQRALQQYMTQYIQARDEQEQARRVPVLTSNGSSTEIESYHPEYAGNPFVAVKSTADMNPFRSEDQ